MRIVIVTVVTCGFLTVWEVVIPNLHFIQGSAVHFHSTLSCIPSNLILIVAPTGLEDGETEGWALNYNTT